MVYCIVGESHSSVCIFNGNLKQVQETATSVSFSIVFAVLENHFFILYPVGVHVVCGLGNFPVFVESGKDNSEKNEKCMNSR